ncbi:MAG: hypothetical protein H7318_10870 [Oligoflexus sp.]|nr:hypothetical protein [Oligoflexus sp.]
MSLLCECSKMPEFYRCLPNGIKKNLPGVSIFAHFFQGPDELNIDLDFDTLLKLEGRALIAKCKKCEQHWYLELAPEETISEDFAVKLHPEQNWQQFDPVPIKQFLTLLAHNGFGQKKCAWVGCDNYALGSTSICLQHYGV